MTTQPESDDLPATALYWSRLAMATLTSQDFIVYTDGALYSPSLLAIFEQARAALARQDRIDAKRYRWLLEQARRGTFGGVVSNKAIDEAMEREVRGR